ncbi:choice-of-anchor Q domain-containing protein [Dokdonella soli]|uniref:CSLREA domain-containing protein n=1 Tax=Dokdonella soli TaxID=529810 RepID=A0ABN1ICM1_9GAMM
MKIWSYLVCLVLLANAGAQASTLNVTSNSGAHNVQNACVLRDAITQLNTGAPTGGCGVVIAPARVDASVTPDCLCTANTIVLPVGITITLNEVDDVANNTGLPVITTSLTIQGNGSTIQRDPMLVCNRNGVTDPGEFSLIASGTTLILNQLTLSGGCADSADYQKAKGGAITNSGTLTLINVVLNGNYASNRGGALYSSGDVGVAGANYIHTSTFENNTSPSGGAIFIEGSSANLIINTSLFLQNSAGQFFAGGALLVGQGSAANIENSTFSKNSAGTGSAIEADGVVAIANSTFAENVASGGGASYQITAGGAGQQTTIKNSLFSENSGTAGNCSFGAGVVALFGVNLSTDASCTGFTLSGTDAKLSPLADNGGPTLTYALSPRSPAVDAVIDCTDNNSVPVTIDQRGHARPQNVTGIAQARCDIGAFELDDRIFSNGFEVPANGI